MEKGNTVPTKDKNATQKKEETANSENDANKHSGDANKNATTQANEPSKLGDSSLEQQDQSVEGDEKSTKDDEEVDDSEELAPLDDHPYKDLHLNFEPTPEQLAPVEDITAPKSIEETPLVEVIKREQLEELIEELKKEKEIAVDLQWSDHGYQAVVCLVMISTRDKDYIIDSMNLKEDMVLLNDIFLDTNIVKIFHSTSNDLKVLQEDFDLFLINLFDTQRAQRALGQTKTGLDVALQEYKIEKDLSMSRVDFRKRPLPPKYKNFARSNSHFLIHMYEKLKNALIEAKSLKKVLNQCSNDCRVVYSKEPDATYAAVRSELEDKHNRQMVALEKLNEWRHRTAEYFDINIDLVIPKDSMRSLAFELTADPASILKISKYSEHVKKHLQEIVDIMARANKGLPPPKAPRAVPVAPLLPKPASGFGYQKTVGHTKFGGVSSYAESAKRQGTFYYEDASWGRGRGRGRGSVRPNEFYSRTTAYSADNYAESPKTPGAFYYDDTSRGRGGGRGNTRPNEFYSRATAYSADNYAECPKTLGTFYYDDTSRGTGRGIGNSRPNEFYSRTTAYSAANYAESPKTFGTFHYDDTSRGRGNSRPNEFYPRSTASNAFSWNNNWASPNLNRRADW